jgi:4-hydroxy-tetrahydrodipicolinate synthase
MLPETVAELSKTKNIVAIKEAGGSVDQVSQIRRSCDITVLSGDDGLTLPMMAVGATGVISVAANVAPAKSAQLCREFDEGNLAGAQKVHYELLPLFKALFIETNPMPVKAALAWMGLIENNLRLPLTPMQESKFAQLEPVLKDLGLEKGALKPALSK